MFTNEEKNYWIFCMLNVQVAPIAVRICFDSKIPPHDLATTINNNIQIIQDLVKKKILNKSQIDLIQRVQGVVWQQGRIANGHSGITSGDFDITLMVCLLRNFKKVVPPSSGWDNLPSNSDSSVGADLARLKFYRNELAHNSKPFISQQDFLDKWQVVEKAVNTLSGGITYQKVQDIYNCDIDGSNSKEIIRMLSEELDDVKEELREAEQNLREVQADFTLYKAGKLPENEKNVFDAMVSSWREDDIVYVETTATKRIRKKMILNNFVVISGNSGSGKTATARHLALQLELKSYQIIPVSSVGDIIKYRNKETKQVFVIDDVVGKYSLQNRLIGDWERHNEQIKTIFERKHVKLICTLRKQVVNDKLFLTSQTILNACVENIDYLNLNEKQAILEQYLERNELEIEQSLMNKICDESVAFPLLCRLFTSNKERFNTKVSFFDKPYQTFKEELERLECRNRLGYCGLVLCMLSTNQLSKDFVYASKYLHLIEDVMEECGLDRNTSRKSLLDALESLVNVYVRKSYSDTFLFLHDSLYESVGFSFGMKSIECLLRHCHVSFILERIRVDITESLRDETAVIVLPTQFKALSNRIAQELKRGCFFVLNSQIMQNKNFETYLCDFLDQDPDFVNGFNHINAKQAATNRISNDSQHLNILMRLYYGKRITLIHWSVAFGCNKLLECFWKYIPTNKKKLYLGDKNVSMILIHLAVLGGDIQTIEFLINNGVEINSYDKDGQTPLIYAIKKNKFDIACLLINNNADVNKKSKHGAEHPLGLAAKLQNKQMLELLLMSKADVNQVTSDAPSAILEAVCSKNTTIIKILLEHSADINLTRNHKRSSKDICLHLAIHNLDIIALNLLLDSGNCDVNISDCDKNTPLLHALRLEDDDLKITIVKSILDKNPDLNLHNHLGESCFSVAFETDMEIFEILLCREVYQGTNLHLAVYQNNLNMVKEHISQCNINSCTPHGWSPLHIASMKNNFEIAELMLKCYQNYRKSYEDFEINTITLPCNEIDINFLDKDGCSPIHLAYVSNSTAIIDILLKCDANVNIPFSFGIDIQGHRPNGALRSKKTESWNSLAGESLLYAAVRGNKTDLASKLLNCNVDTRFKQKNKASMIYMATAHENSFLVHELLEKGADLNLDCQDNSLQLAINSNQADIVADICHFYDFKANDMHCLESACCTVCAKFWCLCCTRCCYNSINRSDENYNTPLHNAVQIDNKDIVKILLENNADITIRNKSGRLPISYAKENSEIYESLKIPPQHLRRLKEITVMMFLLVFFVFVSIAVFCCGIYVPVYWFQTFYNSKFDVTFENGTPSISRAFNNTVNSLSFIEFIQRQIPKSIFIKAIALINFVYFICPILLHVSTISSPQHKRIFYYILIMTWIVLFFPILLIYSATIAFQKSNDVMMHLFNAINSLCILCINFALFILLFSKMWQIRKSRLGLTETVDIEKRMSLISVLLFFIFLLLAIGLLVLVIINLIEVYNCSSTKYCPEFNEHYFTALYFGCNLCAFYLFHNSFAEIIREKNIITFIELNRCKVARMVCLKTVFIIFNICSSVIRVFMDYEETNIKNKLNLSGYSNATQFQLSTEIRYSDVSVMVQVQIFLSNIFIYTFFMFWVFSCNSLQRQHVLMGFIVFVPYNVIFYYLKSYYSSDAYSSMFLTILIIWNFFSVPVILYFLCTCKKGAAKKEYFLKFLFILFSVIFSIVLYYLMSYFKNHTQQNNERQVVFEDYLVYTYDINLATSHEKITISDNKGRLEEPMNGFILFLPVFCTILTFVANSAIIRSLHIMHRHQYVSSTMIFEQFVAVLSSIFVAVLIYFIFP